MKIVISPAKSLDFESKVPTDQFSQFLFQEKAARLNKELKKKSARSLAKLMSISPDLAALNYDRNQQWQPPFAPDNSRQAVYAFTGEVYRGLDIGSLDLGKLDQLQDKLRILSGLYGYLKPLDLIQPYRLEMGTKLKVATRTNLYKFWGSLITDAINDELAEDDLFVNLASNEYFKVIQAKSLKVPVITPVFKDLKNGVYKSIMTFAKNARGQMVRYIIDHDINDLDGLKGFNYNGYGFDASMSSDTELVFTR